jgi:hypothetical protein
VDLPLLLQFSTALFTGLVAATFIPPVRRAIPRPVEVFMWIGLILVCLVGLFNISSESARNLSASVIWATDKVINTIVGLLLGGAWSWIFDHRFVIATWLVIIAASDLLLLILMRSMRKTRAVQPRVRLREWMEMPVPVTASPAHRRAAAADPLIGVNRRLAAGSAVLATAMFTRTVDMSIWIRNVMLPTQRRRLAEAARAGSVGSRARLESLRDTAAQLQFAARAWYTAAGEPAMSGLAVKARAASKSLRPAALRPGQVIDVQALLSAQSIGWYGPLMAPPVSPRGEENDADQPQQTDRLAS